MPRLTRLDAGPSLAQVSLCLGTSRCKPGIWMKWSNAKTILYGRQARRMKTRLSVPRIGHIAMLVRRR